MFKQTRLSDDAQIYQPRDEQTVKERLKEMTFREKLSYLWEYYRIAALITVGVVALVIYIIYSFLSPKIETVFYAAFINNSIDPTILDQYEEDFTEHLQLDPKTEKVEFNYSFYLNNSPEYSMNMQQILSTYLAAQEIDVMIAPESEFKNYTYYGFMAKLTDQLPTDVYSALTNNFYIADTEEDSEKSVYGIYLSDTKLFQNADNSDPYMIGIIVNGKHSEKTIEFIRYLFQ